MENNNEEIVKLISACEMSLRPGVSNEMRRKSFEMLESFKQNHEKCLSVGYALVSAENSSFETKLLGFDLLGSFISNGWINSNSTDYLKFEFKRNFLNYLQESYPSLNTHCQKCAVKIIVAVMVRDFPQKWQDVQHELMSISQRSIEHMKMYLSVYQFLAQDIVTLQISSIPSHRTKQIRHHLTNDKNLLPLMLAINEKLIDLNNANSSINTPNAEISLATSALDCLLEYISWTPVNLLVTDTKLLNNLFLLLAFQSLRNKVADCLIAFASRKGQNTFERAPIVYFFSGAIIEYFESSVVGAMQLNSFIFLGKLVDLFQAMNDFFFFMSGKYINELQSINENDYLRFLELLIYTGKHTSHHITCQVVQILLLIVRNGKKNPFFKVTQTLIEDMVKLGVKLLCKSGFPSQAEPESEYSKILYDDDLEYGSFIGSCRSIGCDFLRHLCNANHLVSLEALLNMFAEKAKEANKIYLSLLDLEFEATCLALTTDLATLKFSKDDPVFCAIQDKLERVFDFCLCTCEEGAEVVMQNSFLSVLSSMFWLWFKSQEVFVRVMKLLFSSLSYQKSNDEKNAYLVHRHASSLLLSKMVAHPNLFLQFFVDIEPLVYQFIIDESKDNNCRTSLIECIVTLCIYEEEPKRSELLRKYFDLSTMFAKTDSFKFFVGNSDNFLVSLGLQEYTFEQERWQNIQRLRFVVQAPSGFMRRYRAAFEPKVSNTVPTVPQMDALTNLTRSLVKTLSQESLLVVLERVHELHLSENCERFANEFKSALEIPELERRNLLGVQQLLNDVSENQTKARPLNEKMQILLKDIHSNCIQSLASCVFLCTHAFGSDSAVIQLFTDSLYKNFDYLSHLYINNIVSFFIIPFKDRCPEAYHQSHLLPILRQFLSLVFPRLCQSWQQLIEKSSPEAMGQNGYDVDDEVTEDLFLRRNTKAVLNVIETSLLSSKHGEGINDDSQMATEDSEARENPNELKLKPFALIALSDSMFHEHVILVIVNTFVWKDAHCCIKAATMFWPLFQYTKENSLSENVVNTVFVQLLKGYQTQEGQTTSSEKLLNLIIKFYSSLRREYPILQSIMLQVPEIEPKFLQDFEEALLNISADKALTDKDKRDGFKTLLKGVVGRPLSSLYKKPSRIIQLPDMPPKVKQEAQNDENYDSIVNLFA